MFTMSHRRPSKRSRNVLNDVTDESSPSSPSMRYSQPKRPKHEEHFDLQETSVRRSSRAPKPKVFDDDYKDSRSPVVEPIERKEATSTHRSQPERRSLDDSVDIVDDSGQDYVRRSSRVPKPKILDEDYFESSKMKSEVRSLERENDEKTLKVLPHALKTKALHVPENTQPGNTVKQHDVQRSEGHKKEKHRKHRNSVEDARLDSVAIGNKKSVSEDQKSRKTGLHVHQKDLSGSSSQGSPKSGAEVSVSDNSGTPKVRTSSRTPVPKKTFALIDDSLVSRTVEGLSEEEGIHVGIEEDRSPHISHKHSNKHSKRASLTQSPGEALQALGGGLQGAQPISKRRGNSWGEAGYAEVHKMKSKPNKSKEEHTRESLVEPSLKLSEASTSKLREGHRNKGNEKGKKHSTKGVNQVGDSQFNEKKTEMEKTEHGKTKKVEIIDEQAKRKPKKKKVDYAVEKAELQSTCTPVSKNQKGPTSEKSHSKHSTSSHGKKATKHSKHIDEPHSETKDEDEHIILKLHLPHAEGSSHSHSHKKHKHKHSSGSKSEATGSENKAKRQKLSFEGASSSSEEKHKQKKLSIKFKGLSGSTPGVEVDVQGSKSLIKTTKDKAVKSESVHVGKKKKQKKPSVEELTSPPAEQEHLKMVIKKNKKEVKLLQSESEKSVSKTVSKEAKPKPKVYNSKPEKNEKRKSLKVTPKKKSKVGESPKLGEKEKRKIVSGYLLFCKKQRSKIYEANPGLEFAQISQKVGEAWNKLPASTKQDWKDKAKAIKDKIMLEEEERRQEAVKTGPDAVDMAAHLKLLGESLSVIGGSLMAQRETEVHGSLSVLLDSILCAICPLTFLTSHIPGIPGIAKEKQEQILDDLAYTMPGLG